MFYRRIAIFFLFISFALIPSFAKPKKNAISVPAKVQEKIKNTPESSKSWYICELKNKTKAGNVIIGPVEQRELVLLIWIANSIQSNKDFCIAKNKTYISKNPESFFKDEFENIKNDINEFGLADTYEKYFFTNYLTRSTKIDVTYDEATESDDQIQVSSEEKSEETGDEELAELAASQLTTKMMAEQSGETEQPEEDVLPEPEAEPEQQTIIELEPKPDEEVAEGETQPESPAEPEPVPEPKKEPESNVITPKEEITESEKQPAQEIAESPKETTNETQSVEYENLLFSKLNQDQETKPTVTVTENKDATPITPTVTQVAVKTEQTEPEKQPETVKETEPENAVEEQPAFELPISSTPSENVSRYQRENLLDYAPKKTPALPSDDDSYTYQKIEFPDKKDSKGCTLLMKAAKAGNNWELKNLLNSGASVNLKDKDGWTALMYAVRYQENTSIIDQLISSGANVKEQNEFNVSALSLAATYNGNPEILRKILSYYSPSEKDVMQAFVLMLSDNYSSDFSKAAKLDAFLEKSVSLNSFYNGKTPLMYAAQYCNSTIILKKLLDYGAGTSIRSADGKTAFDYAKQNPSLPHDDVYWTLNKK